MSYNYGQEREKFNRWWDYLRREYIAAGMSEDDAQAMYDHDWAVFKSERIFRTHNPQSLDNTCFQDDAVSGGDQSPLIHNYLEQLSVRQPEISSWGRCYWVEDIDDPVLAQQLKSLPRTDLELLTCLVTDGLSRAEIARKYNVSRAAITKRINRIKNIFLSNH